MAGYTSKNAHSKLSKYGTAVIKESGHAPSTTAQQRVRKMETGKGIRSGVKPTSEQRKPQSQQPKARTPKKGMS